MEDAFDQNCAEARPKAGAKMQASTVEVSDGSMLQLASQ